MIFTQSFNAINVLLITFFVNVSPTGGCNNYRMERVSPEVAFMGHFKLICDRKCMENTVQDLTLLKFKDQIGPRVEKVLNALHLS